jgi:hypothetical protein
MKYLVAFLGSSPGAFFERVLLAFVRSLRTFVQGVLAAVVSAFAGMSIFDAGYGKAFSFAVIAAAITALTSFLHNVAGFLPDDPTQTAPPKRQSVRAEASTAP